MYRVWALLMGALGMITLIVFALAEPWYVIAGFAAAATSSAALLRRSLERIPE
jgi:membrane protein implicated in regulation of membrane protease activity